MQQGISDLNTGLYWPLYIVLSASIQGYIGHFAGFYRPQYRAISATLQGFISLNSGLYRPLCMVLSASIQGYIDHFAGFYRPQFRVISATLQGFISLNSGLYRPLCRVLSASIQGYIGHFAWFYQPQFRAISATLQGFILSVVCAGTEPERPRSTSRTFCGTPLLAQPFSRHRHPPTSPLTTSPPSPRSWCPPATPASKGANCAGSYDHCCVSVKGLCSCLTFGGCDGVGVALARFAFVMLGRVSGSRHREGGD